MNSGRSSGKQVMSISFRTWLTTPPWSFTPGDFSALVKCSGTSMCSFLFFCTRWKSRAGPAAVDACCRAQQHLLLRAAHLERQDRGVEALVAQVVKERLVVEARC